MQIISRTGIWFDGYSEEEPRFVCTEVGIKTWTEDADQAT